MMTVSLLFVSCLKSGLEDLPAFEEVEITHFNLEHRYIAKNTNGIEQLVSKTLTNGDLVIDADNGTITVNPTIPGASSNFSQEERKKITLANIVVYTKLSPAASIAPLEGAPQLGVPGDFSVPRKYKVTAADGKTTKVWTITIGNLPVIN